ncbi:MAG: C40 family peptidase [Butyricicoccaceae bacterium]
MASYSGLSAKRTAVLDYAAKFLGVPACSYGGSTPSGFDCSGFTSYVYKNTVCSIERVAQAQFDTTTRVSRDELLPGDLVFFGSSAYSSQPCRHSMSATASSSTHRTPATSLRA